MRRVLIAAATLGLAFGAEAKAPSPLTAKDAAIRPAPAGLPMTAAYLTLSNRGARPERLMGVTCECAAEITAHQTLNEGGVMRMRAADAVVVPAHGSVTFKPGGLHLMVMGLKQAIKPGDTVAMTLTFDHAPPLKVRFTAER